MAETTTTATTEPAKVEPKPDPVPPAPDGSLGDAGKKALDEERSARKAAEKSAKEAQAELDKLKASSMTDQEKAVAAARAEGRAEALKVATERLLKAEVRAAASGKLADPDDAIHLLDRATFVGDDGEVNPKAVASAIDALVKSKPYLAAQRPPGNGSGEGGPRGGQTPGKFDGDAWLRGMARRQ